MTATAQGASKNAVSSAKKLRSGSVQAQSQSQAQTKKERLNYKKPKLTPLNFAKRRSVKSEKQASRYTAKPKIVTVSFSGSKDDFTEEDLEPLKKKLRETNKELRRKKTTSELKYAHKNRKKKAKKERIRVQPDVEVVGSAEDSQPGQPQRKVAYTGSQNKKKPSFSTLYQQFQRHYETEVESDPDIEP